MAELTNPLSVLKLSPGTMLFFFVGLVVVFVMIMFAKGVADNVGGRLRSLGANIRNAAAPQAPAVANSPTGAFA